MAKKWIDANKIADVTYIPKNLYSYDDLMKEKPNFNKSEGANEVYERKEYIILAVKKGYIVYNKHKEFRLGHTHIRGYNMAKTIIDNCIKRKMPKTNNIYLISSHVRISTDEKYIEKIEALIEAKKKDRVKYINKRIK